MTLDAAIAQVASTDRFVALMDDDSKTAFGPFDDAGLLAFAREILVEGFEDVAEHEPLLSPGGRRCLIPGCALTAAEHAPLGVDDWSDDEVREEFLDHGWQVRALITPGQDRTDEVELALVNDDHGTGPDGQRRAS